MQVTDSLSLNSRELIKLDLLSASDPQVFVYIKEKNTEKWNQIGTTEHHKDDPNPIFKKTFLLDFKFEGK
jgi:hypothetical protein